MKIFQKKSEILTYFLIFCNFFKMSTTEDFYRIPHSQSQEQSLSYDFDMGTLLFQNGSFQKSLLHLKKAMSFFLQKENLSNYLICYNMIMQIFSEIGDTKSLFLLKQEVEAFCKNQNISKTPRVLTSSAYYQIYIEKNLPKAKEYLDKALKVVFDMYDRSKVSNDQLDQVSARFEVINCLYFYSMYYFRNKEYQNCSKEIQNVKILLEDFLNIKTDIEISQSKTDNPEQLQIYRKILEALDSRMRVIQNIRLILKYIEANIETFHINNYEQSKKLLWELYEETNKANYRIMTPYIFISMALNYIKLKNNKQARMFFHLTEKNITSDRKLLISFLNELKEKIKLDETESDKNYDLIFDLKDHLIVEKEKGCVELKNQFILLDLLKLFILNPGVSYSKEEIVSKIWKEEYLPEIHDNKIYVTIKRLREVIEINSCKPKYICRNSRGYYFSKHANVLVKAEEVSNV